MFDTITPLIWGVDTLHLSYLAPVPPATIESLKKAKAEARSRMEARTQAPSVVMLAGKEWVVRPQSAPPYSFMLHRPEEMDLQVAGRSLLADGTPTIVIELRSAYLWHRGWKTAARDAQALAKELLESPAECLETVSRIDLAVDFQGWRPDGSDAEKRRMSKRVRKGFHQHGFDDDFTGYSIGTGNANASLYDKTEEIRGSEKMWFHDLWKRHEAYDATAPVWRFEARALTELLKEQGLREGWASNVEPRVDELWRYFVGHPDWNPEEETSAARALRDLRKTLRTRYADELRAELERAGEPGDDEAKRSQAHRILEAVAGRFDPDAAAELRTLAIEVADEQRNAGAWFSMREPVRGKNAARWPMAPEWKGIQRVTFTREDAPRGFRLVQREACIENKVRQVDGLLASIGANLGIKPRPGDNDAKRCKIARYSVFGEVVKRAGVLDVIDERNFANKLGEKGAALEVIHERPKSERKRLPLAPWEALEEARRWALYDVESFSSGDKLKVIHREPPGQLAITASGWAPPPEELEWDARLSRQRRWERKEKAVKKCER